MNPKNTISFWFKGESFNMTMDANNFFTLFRFTTTNNNGGNVGDRLHVIFMRGDFMLMIV